MAPHDEDIIDILTLAFCDDPPTRYVWPRASAYLASFPRFVKDFGGDAFIHGLALEAEGHAAALALTPGAHGARESLNQLFRDSVSGSIRVEAEAMFEQMERCAPAEPHWHLALLGVDPPYRGQGLGSQLLSRLLAKVDDLNDLIYLENSNPRNTPLYERCGFHALGVIQVGGYPPLYPMLRPRRG